MKAFLFARPRALGRPAHALSTSAASRSSTARGRTRLHACTDGRHCRRVDVEAMGEIHLDGKDAAERSPRYGLPYAVSGRDAAGVNGRPDQKHRADLCSDAAYRGGSGSGRFLRFPGARWRTTAVAVQGLEEERKKTGTICSVKKKSSGQQMKKMLLASTYVASVIMLGACGGGGESNTSVPQQAAKAKQPVSILQLGDSTTWGQSFTNGTYAQTPNASPVELQIALQLAYGPTVTVTNGGVGSSTLGSQINGTLPNTITLAQVLQGSAAQIVTLNFGINDSAPYGNETPTQFQAYLEQSIDAIRALGKTPVLEEPNPVGVPTYAGANATTYSQLATYVAVIDAVAAEKNVALVQQYAYVQSLPDWQSMVTDGVHPNDALYKIKAEREAAIIGPIVASMQ